ncbi:murein biosynthesis integral membrane protein MurJ [uncultured Pseudokineococcus sp.]|uniref:murein biosynthesis integral membrane protein MurJ n=1 Tax=uncultured Pseudokineococcus sp. TaxID=1642928 RepID=UPI00260A5CF9|nr:lipid II flippase MurJ [uncultured Pseudokineococcus sp.]
MRPLGRGLLGAAALIAVLTALARVAGFLRGLVFTAGVGNATVVGEAYNAANTVPNVLFEVVAGGALAGAVVPLLAGPLAAGDRRGAERVVGALLGWTLVLLVPAAVAVAALAGPLSHLLRPGAALADQRALVAAMLVVFAPQVVLYGLGVVLTGALQAQRRFTWPALAPLLSSLTVIGAYALYARLSGPGSGDGAAAGPALAVLAGGTTLGVAVLTLPLLGPVLAGGLRPRPTLRFPPGVLRRARGLAAAGLLALLAQQAAVLTALLLGGRLGDPVPGSFSVFVQVVQPVSLLPYAVLAVPLATSAFPRLAEMAARGDAVGFARTAAASTRAVVLVALLGSALLVAVAPAVQALYAALDAGGAGAGGGRTTAYAAVADAVTAVAPALLGLALVAHVGRALYALERGRAAATATVTGWLAVVVAEVALAAVLPGEDRVVALAAGTSAGMVVAAALLLRALGAAAGPRALAGVGRTLAASLGAGAAGAVVGRLVVDALLGALDGSDAGTELAAVGAGAAGAAAAVLVTAAGAALLDRRTAAAALARLRGRRGVRQGGAVPGSTPGATPGDGTGRDGGPGGAPGSTPPRAARDDEGPTDGRGRERT